jgi:hypothetical protein
MCSPDVTDAFMIESFYEFSLKCKKEGRMDIFIRKFNEYEKFQQNKFTSGYIHYTSILHERNKSERLEWLKERAELKNNGNK